MGPYIGCMRCGWCVHSSHAKEFTYCPKCTKKLEYADDTRDFTESDEYRIYKEYREKADAYFEARKKWSAFKKRSYR